MTVSNSNGSENDRLALQHKYKMVELKYESDLKNINNHQEHERRKYESFHRSSLDGVITIGQNAAKALLLANGGALVALLAYFGSLFGRAGTDPQALHATAVFDLAKSMRPALMHFVLGFAAIVLAMMISYLSQSAVVATSDFPQSDWKHEAAKRWAVWCWGFVILAAGASFVLFVTGAFSAVTVLTSGAPKVK